MSPLQIAQYRFQLQSNYYTNVNMQFLRDQNVDSIPKL